MSPTLRVVTLLPTSTTLAVASCPITTGLSRMNPPQFPSWSIWMSVPHNPQNRVVSWTSERMNHQNLDHNVSKQCHSPLGAGLVGRGMLSTRKSFFACRTAATFSLIKSPISFEHFRKLTMKTKRSWQFDNKLRLKTETSKNKRQNWWWLNCVLVIKKVNQGWMPPHKFRNNLFFI